MSSSASPGCDVNDAPGGTGIPDTKTPSIAVGGWVIGTFTTIERPPDAPTKSQRRGVSTRSPVTGRPDRSVKPKTPWRSGRIPVVMLVQPGAVYGGSVDVSTPVADPPSKERRFGIVSLTMG